MGEELPSHDEVARYDSVQESRPAAETSLGRPDWPASKTAGGGATQRPPAMGVTVALIAVLMVASLVVLVAGLAMVDRELPRYVPVIAITIGGSLLAWHVRAVIAGSGRRTAMISPWPWIGLVVVAAFGATLGFALFDLLTGVRSAARVALVSAGTVGMLAGVMAFVRDADIREQARTAPPAQAQPEPEPEPEPAVYFDPSDQADSLRPRGTWPLPRRGTTADASLWEESAPEEPAPPRRARRGV